jgi:alpha-L-arabinofuranosidase
MTTVEQSHPLLRFNRRDGAPRTELTIDIGQPGAQVPRSILGNFFEHLSCSTLGGVSAELLSNPTFAREHYLTPTQIGEFVQNGRLLCEYYLSGDPAVLRRGWVSTPLATGFGVAILDDATHAGLPLGWAPIGYPASVRASVGRLGGAVRLRGGTWPTDPDVRWSAVDDGPAGVRQGAFLPSARCRDYSGTVWLRIGSQVDDAQGQLEVGLRRRIATPDGSRRAGEILASVRLDVHGSNWQRLAFELSLADGAVGQAEPVDVYARWLPRSRPDLDLLLDRLSLMPADAIEGLDPAIVNLVQTSTVARLRWPGGNFVSYYHWRDGIGPVERRPTYANRAWGGLEYNIIGTDEYVRFCRLTGAEPYITVNSGTATAEEAAAWVEYCNGPVTTPMGSLRARNGNPEPYDVRIWEVGNENFGYWQGGFVGSDENARRFSEFAAAMRSASPIPIELIACGSNFDFAPPGPDYDHVTADRRWHDSLLEAAPNDIDYISLHALPVNDHLLEGLGDQQAHEAVLAQVTTWERCFLPDLLRRCDAASRSTDRPPIKLAMTEWGPLGQHPARLMVENFGAVVYTGTFLNFMIRNSARIPIASPNGFMHGGCIRKVLGIVFTDPQWDAMQRYTPFIGSTPAACQVTGPGYDVPRPADLGGPEADVPYVDAIACRTETGNYLLAAANRHISEGMELEIRIPGHSLPELAQVAVLAHPDITARATPAEPNRFPIAEHSVRSSGGTVRLTLPPSSVTWIRL